MFKTKTIKKTTIMLWGSILLLSGCSTIDNFIGGGLNDPTNMEVADDINSNAPEMTDGTVSSFEVMPMEPVETFQTTEEMLNEKDQALISQGMRLAVAEKELMAIQEEKSMLKQELDAAKKDASDKQAMLDQQNNRQVTPVSSGPRVTAPDGGYGLHVASYQRQESIAPGLAAIGRQVPVLTQGRPVKVANATVRGRTYLRLIIGQFNLQSEAIAECNQAKLLIDFCDVVAFEGEDF